MNSPEFLEKTDPNPGHRRWRPHWPAASSLTGGEYVWWNAADIGVDYYHLPVSTNSPPTGAALLVFDPGPGFDASLPPPDLIAVSKPDIFDRQGVLAACLQAHRYQKVASLRALSIRKKTQGEPHVRSGSTDGGPVS